MSKTSPAACRRGSAAINSDDAAQRIEIDKYDKHDCVVALETNFSNRRSRMLLNPLCRELRAGLHHATPSCVSTPRTALAFASLIRCAREFGAVRKAQCGAVTFIQRFGSALNLN